MEQCFEWLSRPSNDGKPIDQKVLARLLSASREGSEGDPPPPLAPEVCHLLLRRLLKEAVTESALSTGLALCSALLSSGLSDVPGRVCGLLRGETPRQSPYLWFADPVGVEEEEWLAATTVSDVCVIGICHGTVNTALHRSFDRAQLQTLVAEALLPLCRKPSRLTTTALRVLTSAVARLPPEVEEDGAGDFLGDALLPLVRFGWSGPANSPKEIRRLTETFLVSHRGSPACRKVTGEVLALAWGSRAKLLALSALWSVCAREEVLECDPNLPEKLAASLSEPRLVSAGTDAYLAFLGHLKDAEDWWSFFAGPLLPLLLSDGDWGATRALFTHWLPPTLKKFPGLYQKLVDAVPGDDDAQLCSLALLHNEASKIMFVPVDLLPDGTDLVSRSLRHEKETVRLAAFSLLCRGFTPGQGRGHQEAVASFLEDNITCDSVPLRQGVVSCVRTLLARIGKEAVSEGASPTSSFLLWLHGFLTENLTVGVGNYQRRLLSLLLFGCVLSVAEQSAQVFRRLAPDGQWSAESLGNLDLLLRLVLWDPARNIRQEAAKVLAGHFAPRQHHLSCRLAARGLSACRSRWFFRAEVAAEVFGLVSAWTGNGGVCCGCLEEVLGSDDEPADLGTGEQQRHGPAGGKVDGSTHVLGCPAKVCALQVESLFSSLFYGGGETLEGGIGELSLSDCSCPEEEHPTAPEEETPGKVSLVSLLLREGGGQWPRLRDDPVEAAAKGSSVHGALSALTSLPAGSFSSGQVRTALALVEELADWVLGVLASQSSGLSPSFADMGVALSSLADNVESDEQLLHLSPAFQTALNCLWLNLKACCEVSAHLVSSPFADGDVAVRFLRVITSVLTQCRHKGAIEAAGRALSAFVRVVTSEKCDRVTRTGVLLRDVPGKLLAAILDLLGNAETTVSVTRRSAGVAILVHRIVVGDGAYGHPLLDAAVRRLLALAASPVDPEQPANVDSPQARAVHCLTAIVREASLRSQVSAHVGEVTLLCLRSLVNSGNWSVRNAGLQLYAAAAPRLCGGADQSSLEAVTWRYPPLGRHLASRPHEVPALSLLAGLCCDADSAPSRSAPEGLLRRLAELCSESRPRQVRRLAAEAFARGAALRSLPSAVEALAAECGGGPRSWRHWNGLEGRLLCLEAALRRLGAAPPACVSALAPPPGSPWPCREVLDRVAGRRPCLGELLGALGDEGAFHQPGFFPWAEARARDLVGRCDATELLPLLTGAGLHPRCLDVCLAALEELRRRRPRSPQTSAALLGALAPGGGGCAPELERALLEAAAEHGSGAAVPAGAEAALERLADHNAAALPPLTRVAAAAASPRRPRLLRLLAARLSASPLDDDVSRRRHCAAALATLLPSLGGDDDGGEAAEALLGAAVALSEDDDEGVRRAVGRPPPPSRVLGPRRAALFLWRRLADVGGGGPLLDDGGRPSPFGQESDALREEPCRVAALEAGELAAILAGEQRGARASIGASMEAALDVAALEDAVARVEAAHGNGGTYLTLSAARLLSVKLRLLHDTLSRAGGGDSGLRDALRGLRGRAEGCLEGLAP